jgi:hypothetical protein
MEFPIYAKHPDGQVWYKIHSKSSFSELRTLGQRVTITKVLAQDYSTSLYINDLIEAIRAGKLDRITAADFDAKSLENQ